MSTTLDASVATFKIPLELFNLPHNYSEDLRKEATDLIPRRKRQNSSGEIEAPISGYRDYLLFALRTRMLPVLQNLMGRNIVVSFTGYPAATMVLSYTSDREPQINNNIEKEVKDLLIKQVELPPKERLECLLLKWNSVRYLTPPVGASGVQERIPGKWLRSIIQFIPGDNIFSGDPTIPKVIYRDSALYADCLHTSDPMGFSEDEYFMDLYSRLGEKILLLIKQWYLEGRIVDPPNEIIEKWKLDLASSIDGKMLFKPQDDWGISKLSRGSLLDLPVSGLLYDLIKGKERTVPIRAGVNLVDYHGISKMLFGRISTGDYYFSSGALNFTARTMEDLLFVVNVVDRALYGGEVSGAVFTLSSSRLSWIRVFSLITQRSISKDLAVYVRRDLEPEFVFSAMVPLNANISELRKEVLLRSRRLLVYLMKKLETSDIHAYLDNPQNQLPEDLSSPTARSYMNDNTGVMF